MTQFEFMLYAIIGIAIACGVPYLLLKCCIVNDEEG